MKNRVKDGITLDYKNTTLADIASGDIVKLSKRIAVACVDIAVGKTGSVDLEGVFTLPKKSGEAFVFGDELHCDTDGNLTKTASGTTKYAGICADAEGQISASTSCNCRLQSGSFTLDT